MKLTPFPLSRAYLAAAAASDPDDAALYTQASMKTPRKDDAAVYSARAHPGDAPEHVMHALDGDDTVVDAGADVVTASRLPAEPALPERSNHCSFRRIKR